MKIGAKILIIAAVLLVLTGGVLYILASMEMKAAPDPRLAAQEHLGGLIPAEGEFSLLSDFSLDEDYRLGYRRAELSGQVTYFDADKLSAGLAEEMNKTLALYVEQARLSSDVYNEDNTYKTSVLESAFNEVLSTRMAEVDTYTTQGDMTIELKYDGESWSVTALHTPIEGRDADEARQMLYDLATEKPVYVKKQYRIAENAVCGPVAEQENYGSTDDPAVIQALLASPMAQALLNGQETAWNPERDFIPGRQMRYYLDETLLVLQWQEVTSLAVGTFSEIAVADGSQLRRKMAGDKCGSYVFDYPTELARQANAVLAVGGDLYNHARNCGIVVYDREIYRFRPTTCDTCFVTGDGELLFSRMGELATMEEAEAYIKDNDVLFSLCFGPVLIEDGQDVTPWSYPWGEINDTYARSALGTLGELHYLTLNINCEWDGYYYLATLKQATEAMLAHGCQSAYALDGGQTACTVMNGELINVVQFNTEKLTSDMLYFATALPSAE